MSSPLFIGLGVEKAATSWIFACLYEHPQICIPIKEINFFSDDEKWKRGIKVYKEIFQERCTDHIIQGEFSTSYFCKTNVARRIKQYFPDPKLLVCLRNPIDRAYSNYRNDIMAGRVSKSIDFQEAIKIQDYYLGQGHYKKQFTQYFKYFSKDQFHIMVYEDIATDPQKFIQNLFRFLKVDDTFIPDSLTKKINVSRTPGNVQVEGIMNRIANTLHESKWGNRLWWSLKKSGLPSLLRNVNTDKKVLNGINKELQKELNTRFQEDQHYVENLLNRQLPWS